MSGCEQKLSLFGIINLDEFDRYGERFWFSAEEEKEIQENNRAFYKQSPAQEIFYKCFRLPYTSNASQMGKTLQALGVRHTHTRQGNAYLVIPV